MVVGRCFFLGEAINIYQSHPTVEVINQLKIRIWVTIWLFNSSPWKITMGHRKTMAMLVITRGYHLANMATGPLTFRRVDRATCHGELPGIIPLY